MHLDYENSKEAPLSDLYSSTQKKSKNAKLQWTLPGTQERLFRINVEGPRVLILAIKRQHEAISLFWTKGLCPELSRSEYKPIAVRPFDWELWLRFQTSCLIITIVFSSWALVRPEDPSSWYNSANDDLFRVRRCN